MKEMKAKNLFYVTVATASATMLSLFSAGITQAASIIQDQSHGASQINAFSPIGQTFTAEDARIDSIGFFVTDFNQSLARNDFSLGIELYEGVGNDATFMDGGVFNSLFNGFNGYADVDFSSVRLNVGSIYTAMIIDNTVRWGVEGSSSDPYPGGVAIVNDSPSPSSDLRFRVLVSEEVPEPLTILGTTTALGFGALFRKKRAMKAE